MRLPSNERLSGLALAISLVAAAAPTPVRGSSFEQLFAFPVPEANQAVAVDANYFYAIDNRTIAKYNKQTGQFVTKWQGASDGPIIHLDSGMVMNGVLYCAHSNYSQYPMTSSVEMFDVNTMQHIGTHSFGIHWGSLTWLDWYDNAWWAGFANYDQPYGPGGTLYGGKVNTTVVKFDAKWQWQEAWTEPKAILDKFELMSNSGGTWGPDGYLYLSGHDPQEVYKMRLPSAGSVLELVETIPLPGIRGQGIAWDRSIPGKNQGILWGIMRKERLVTASRLHPN